MPSKLALPVVGSVGPANYRLMATAAHCCPTPQQQSLAAVLWSPVQVQAFATTVRAAMAKTQIEELLHRINNLLGTIQLQVEVARTLGTHVACVEALRLIADSATRTDEAVRRLRTGLDLKE